MIKKKLYPKTSRINFEDRVVMTEKLDGSNLVFFKINDQLNIAQRNNIYSLAELDSEDVRRIVYKGLYGWLKEHGDKLEEVLQPNAAVCGEWLGMGHLKYDVAEFPHRFYMFAKANIKIDIKKVDIELANTYYQHNIFEYSFTDKKIPDFIGLVPSVCELEHTPNKEDIDAIYSKYCDIKGRSVEGFVINIKNEIRKYVRLKNGKFQEHFNWTNN